MCGNFCVGFRFKHVAFLQHFFFDWLKVLNDAIVNDGYTTAGHMRMCVSLRYTAMGRPTRVCHSDMTSQRMLRKLFLELDHFANGST